MFAIHRGTKSAEQNIKHIIWKEVIKFSMPHMYHPKKVHIMATASITTCIDVRKTVAHWRPIFFFFKRRPTAPEGLDVVKTLTWCVVSCCEAVGGLYLVSQRSWTVIDVVSLQRMYFVVVVAHFIEFVCSLTLVQLKRLIRV